MADYYSLNMRNHLTDTQSVQRKSSIQKHSKSQSICKRHSKNQLPESHTFKPKINPKSNSLQRNLSDLFKWNEIKQTRNVMLTRYFQMQQDIKQKCINPISDEIAKYSRPLNQPVETILIEKGNQTNQKLKQRAQELYGNQNIPKICEKSKKLHRDQSIFERLYGLTPQKSKQLKEVRSAQSTQFQSPLSSNKSLKQLNGILSNKRESQNQLSCMLLNKFKQKQEEQMKEQMKENIDIKEQVKTQESQKENVMSENKIKECFVSLVDVQKSKQIKN